jgi:predicted oxidoreductase
MIVGSLHGEGQEAERHAVDARLQDKGDHMHKIKIARCDLDASEIALGCLRISEMSNHDIAALIHTALDEGINFFDHADIYGGGTSEEKFAAALAMTPRLRDTMILQTKVGIRQRSYDFSKAHILAAVEGSLKRLRTDHLDVVLLHRPDALVEPEEVAEAFTSLQDSGKGKYFGVSNHNPMQIELLTKFVTQPIIINQLQLSITNTGMIDAGLHVNMKSDASIDRDGSILDYCRLKEITIQPWSPFQYGDFAGVFLDNDKFPELNAQINAVAASRGVSNTAIAVAWLLRHPARMQPIIGTTKPSRVKECCTASDVKLTRQEWYDIYLAAGNTLP